MEAPMNAFSPRWPISELRIAGRGSPSNLLLELLSDPFQPSLQTYSILTSLAVSGVLTVIFLVAFLFLRPRHTRIYAPKLKDARQHSKHTLPLEENGIFSWIKPVLGTKTEDLVDSVGIDAAIFLQFTKMCSHMFAAITLIGCAIVIPVNFLTQSSKALAKPLPLFVNITPLHVKTNAIWCQVVCAWLLNFLVLYLLWQNSATVRKMCRRHFRSLFYQQSVHARALLVTHIPPDKTSNEGLLRLIEEANPLAKVPIATIGRSIRALPGLVKEHDTLVRQLEDVLARFLKDPDRVLFRQRPTMRCPRQYGNQNPSGRVDAIDYLTTRIQHLEEEITYMRESFDRREAMQYGFVSWERPEFAHAVAFSAQKKRFEGARIRLAPQPNDLIWENLTLSKRTLRWKRVTNTLLASGLTVIWVVPNAMMAVFLSNLSNLGLLWPAMGASLKSHPQVWSIVQGVLSPALLSLVYLVLPIVFRRLSVREGVISKTSREHHVLCHMYSFFVFNNWIIFTLFSAIWTLFVAAVFVARSGNKDYWQVVGQSAILEKIVSSMCNRSPFWVTWLLQRVLFASFDLLQVVNFFWLWFSKKFRAPTPRQSIEWTAPRSFDYAFSYTYFLCYVTIALSLATIQPVVLPVTALLFIMEFFYKKYQLLYIFETKMQSGGLVWRILCNRVLFSTLIADCAIATVIAFKGTVAMIACMIPLPFLLLAFKMLHLREFGSDCEFFNRGDFIDREDLGHERSNSHDDQLSTKFGHPALYRPLLTPMVYASQSDALRQVYHGSQDASHIAYDPYAIPMGPVPSFRHQHSSQEPGDSMSMDPSYSPHEAMDTHIDFSYVEDHPELYDETCETRPTSPMERSHTPRPPSIIDRILPSVRKSVSMIKPSGIAWQPLEEIDPDTGRSEIPLRTLNDSGSNSSDGDDAPPSPQQPESDERPIHQ